MANDGNDLLERHAAVYGTQHAAEPGLNGIRAPMDYSPARIEFPDPVPASKLASQGAAVDWILHGYLAKGAVTLLTSLWKSGKSTLLAHLAATMATGGTLADLDVLEGKILIVSEELQALWAGRRDKLNIGDHASFICRPFMGRPTLDRWTTFVSYLAEIVRRNAVRLVCFDTFAAVSPCDDENDAAKMMAVLMPLHRLTQAGAGVLLCHHPKKGMDAGEGQAARGSGALPAFVDVILEMRRAAPAEPANRQRVIVGYSRFDETPSDLVIELREDGTGYSSLGPRHEADRRARLELILETLPGEAPGATTDEVRENWPHKPKPGKRRLEVDLNEGAAAGRWNMSGAGKKGDPHRFWSNK
jgi:hypothetical protein